MATFTHPCSVPSTISAPCKQPWLKAACASVQDCVILPFSPTNSSPGGRQGVDIVRHEQKPLRPSHLVPNSPGQDGDRVMGQVWPAPTSSWSAAAAPGQGALELGVGQMPSSEGWEAWAGAELWPPALTAVRAGQGQQQGPRPGKGRPSSSADPGWDYGCAPARPAGPTSSTQQGSKWYLEDAP